MKLVNFKLLTRTLSTGRHSLWSSADPLLHNHISKAAYQPESNIYWARTFGDTKSNSVWELDRTVIQTSSLQERFKRLKKIIMHQGDNSSQNGTLTRVISLGKYQVWYHTILALLALCIILHNFLVLFLYSKVKTLHNSTNFLLVSLSCADFLTGFGLIPSLITSAALSGRNHVLLYFTSNVISDFVTLAIVLNLSLVTFERYIALCYPYLHPKLAKTRVTSGVLVFIWIFAITVAIIPLSWSYPLLIGKNEDVNAYYKYYSLTSLIGCFFLPSGVMLFCLVSMFLVINRFVRQDTARGLSVRSGQRAQRKAVFVFLAMYISLFVCWSPLMYIRLLMDTKKNFFPPEELLEILVALRCSSSLLNPAIYVWCKKDFKKAFMKIFFKRFQTRNNNTRSQPAAAENEERIKESLL